VAAPALAADYDFGGKLKPTPDPSMGRPDWNVALEVKEIIRYYNDCRDGKATAAPRLPLLMEAMRKRDTWDLDDAVSLLGYHMHVIPNPSFLTLKMGFATTLRWPSGRRCSLDRLESPPINVDRLTPEWLADNLAFSVVLIWTRLSTRIWNAYGTAVDAQNKLGQDAKFLVNGERYSPRKVYVYVDVIYPEVVFIDGPSNYDLKVSLKATGYACTRTPEEIDALRVRPKYTEKGDCNCYSK